MSAARLDAQIRESQARWTAHLAAGRLDAYRAEYRVWGKLMRARFFPTLD